MPPWVAPGTRARAFYLVGRAFVEWNKAVIGSARREMSLLHRRPSRIIPQKSSAFDRRRTFSAGTSFSGFLSGFLSIAHIRFRDLPRGEGREGKRAVAIRGRPMAIFVEKRGNQRGEFRRGWVKISPLCSSYFLSRTSKDCAESAKKRQCPLFYCVSVIPIRWGGSLIGNRNRISHSSLALDGHETVKRWWW